MSILEQFDEISLSMTPEKFGAEDSITIDKVIDTSKKKFLDLDIEFQTKNDSSVSLLWGDEELLEDLDEDSSENKVNNIRSSILDKKFSSHFLSLLREEDFEFGYKTRSEALLDEQLQINALATRNWLNELFLKNYAEETITIGILRILGRFEPSLIFPQGQTIALAALIHKSDEIKELGIRAFEQWCSLESLEILKNTDIQTSWLKDYRDDVIADFEEQLCHC